jgi:hypothetical protein
MVKHVSSVITHYNYVWQHRATHRVSSGVHIASMKSGYHWQVTPRMQAWVFDLRRLGDVDMVEFRVTSERGTWLGKVPRARLPRKVVSIAASPEGDLLLGRRYSAYFRKVA